MADHTKIEWTDATWNPLRGCARVSEGCRHCYAEGVAARFSGPGQAYEGLATRTNKGPRWTGKIQFVESVLRLVLVAPWPRTARTDRTHLMEPRMKARSREIANALLAELRRRGLDGIVERGSKHRRLVFTCNGKEHKFSFPTTPSDRNARTIKLGELRRMLREMNP